mmetsp:Transcript_54473/g.162257  ORF Transcript_54473/g.162257 Transcript_54473/m.162257 type:complete len:222 (+) Transcript_54473:811-1476(+)
MSPPVAWASSLRAATAARLGVAGAATGTTTEAAGAAGGTTAEPGRAAATGMTAEPGRTAPGTTAEPDGTAALAAWAAEGVAATAGTVTEAAGETAAEAAAEVTTETVAASCTGGASSSSSGSGNRTLSFTRPCCSKSLSNGQVQVLETSGSAMGTVASPTRRSSVPSTLKTATFRNCSLDEKGTRISASKTQSSLLATTPRLPAEACVLRSSKAGRPASLW